MPKPRTAQSIVDGVRSWSQRGTISQAGEALGLTRGQIQNIAVRYKISFAKPQVSPPEKRCMICGGPMPKKHGEDNNRYAKRATCGQKCGRKLGELTIREGRETHTAVPPKNCAICDTEFHIRERETPREFDGRQTCGKLCSVELAKKTSAERHHRGAAEVVNWPRVVGPIELPRNAFSRNVAPVEYGSPPSRAITQTLGGVTSDWGRGLG